MKLLKIAAVLSSPTGSEEFPACMCTIKLYIHYLYIYIILYIVYKYTFPIRNIVKAGSPPIVAPPPFVSPQGKMI